VKPVINHSGTINLTFSHPISLTSTSTSTTPPKHIEQSKTPASSRSRTFRSPTLDDEIDVTYDKALSRRLLNENVGPASRRGDESKVSDQNTPRGFGTVLIDIANLPDRARPQDVREIKERVQKTEIVAALLDYQDRGANNR
jgi:hypothetical protein